MCVCIRYTYIYVVWGVISSPSLNNDVAKAVAAVPGWCGPAHVYYKDELAVISPLHKHTHEQDVSSAKDHLTLPIRLSV